MKSDKKLYLKHFYGCFGEVGKETAMTDYYNNPLFVGDIVAAYYPKEEISAKSFVANDDVLNYSYISGFVNEYSDNFQDKERLRVVKLKSYTELKVENEFTSPIINVRVSEVK